MSDYRTHRFPDLEALSSTLATSIAEASRQTGKPGLLSLPGGRSPLRLIRILARTGAASLFGAISTVDERWSPEDFAQTNARMLRSEFGPSIRSRLIALDQTPDLSTAVARFETSISPWLNDFSVAVLAIGDDGHIASLFPGGPELSARNIVCASTSPIAPFQRCTLTLSSLARAKNIHVIIVGGQKQDLLYQVALRQDSHPLKQLVNLSDRNINLWISESSEY